MRDFWSDVVFVVSILFGMAVPIVACVLMVIAFIVAVVWGVMGVRDILRQNVLGCVALALAIVAVAVGVALAAFLCYCYLLPIASEIGR